MPISGKYTWKESHVDITVYIPFRGKSLKKVDLFVADYILKVSHPPFLLDLNLFKTVHTDSCKAVLKNDTLIINLKKVVPCLWHVLVYDDKRTTKEEMKIRRRDSIQRREDEIRQQHEKARSKKLEEERMALRNQMDLDQAEHQHIEDLKKKEKKDAEDNLYKSISEFNTEKIKEDTTTCPSRMEVEILEQENSSTENKETSMTTSITHSRGEDNEDCKDEGNEDIFDQSLSLPPTRKPSCVRFKHTPRMFKTPIRESTLLREKEFLVKNRPYLSSNKYFNTDNADVSEVDPKWLKRKGDEFYIGGDYLSAINAYSEAFEKDSEFLQALTNRSACYLHIGEPQRCICDGEQALQLIQNGTVNTCLSATQLIAIHKKILIRIATAHCQVGEELVSFQNALKYLEKASHLDKLDTSLSLDIERVKVIYEALHLKGEADELLAHEKIESAISMYKKTISKENTLLSAKVNCATALLLQNDFKQCISLCEDVLDMLKATGPCKHGVVPPIGSIPLAGTDRRRKIVLATLYKKAEAYAKLEKFEKALAELGMAKTISCQLKLDDENKLNDDICKMKARIHV